MSQKVNPSFFPELRLFGQSWLRSRQRLERAASVIAAACVIVGLAACTTPQYPNQALGSNAANPEFQPFPTDSSPDDPIVIMAFSGGGSRATALSLSVLQQLRSFKYQHDDKSERLIDRVVAVSSVSGGSVTAGYLGLYGADNIDGLTSAFLIRDDKPVDNMAALEWTAANPITWFRLATGRYTRIDALRDLFDDRLFHHKHFSDMVGRGHPIILLNATDMVSGEVFAFTPQRFNDICSDLAALPLSVGVAASAAFPVALSPMDLKNYSGVGCNGAIPSAKWIETDLKSRAGRYLNLEEFKRARYANALRHGPDAFRDIRYLHLLDGGVADNQGIHSLMDTLFSPHGPVRLLNAINRGERKSIVIITVNARSDPPSSLDQDSGTPGIISMIKSVTSVPLDSATASLNAEMQVLIDTLMSAGSDASKAPSDKALFAGLKVYGVSVDFDQFLPAENALRNRVKAIGTTWTLTKDELETVEQAGKLLLHQNPCFQRLLMDLKIPADFIDPNFATSTCPVSASNQ